MKAKSVSGCIIDGENFLTANDKSIENACSCITKKYSENDTQQYINNNNSNTAHEMAQGKILREKNNNNNNIIHQTMYAEKNHNARYIFTLYTECRQNRLESHDDACKRFFSPLNMVKAARNECARKFDSLWYCIHLQLQYKNMTKEIWARK